MAASPWPLRKPRLRTCLLRRYLRPSGTARKRSRLSSARWSSCCRPARTIVSWSVLRNGQAGQALQVDTGDAPDLDEDHKHAVAAAAAHRGPELWQVNGQLGYLADRPARSADTRGRGHLGPEPLDQQPADRITVQRRVLGSRPRPVSRSSPVQNRHDHLPFAGFAGFAGFAVGFGSGLVTARWLRTSRS